MDTIEKQINEIDNYNTKSIEKQKTVFTNVMHKMASISVNCCKATDTELNRIFDGIVPNVECTGVFNPKYVVEFRDNKAYQVIDNWDKTVGILPNRKVVNTAPISVQEYGAIIFTSNTDKRGNKITPETSIRSNGRPNKVIFYIDNYLNLYNMQKGIYLMFNKTSFPDIAFMFGKYYGKTIYGDYNVCSNPYTKDGQPNTVDYRPNTDFLGNGWEKSLDMRDKFLESMSCFVPPTIKKEFDFYDRFRRFKSFSTTNGLSDEDIDQDREHISNENIIKLLQGRINEMILRLDASEQIMTDMTDKYNQKLVDVQMYVDKIGCLEEKIVKIKSTENETLTEKICGLEKDNFSLNARLMEGEKYRIELASMGLVARNLDEDKVELESKLKKIKHINDGLLEKIKSMKKSKNISSNDYKVLIGNWNDQEVLCNRLKKTNDELKNDLNAKSDECITLTESLKNMIDNPNTDVTEKALYDKIEVIQEKLNARDESISMLKTKNKKLTDIVDKYEKLAQGMKELHTISSR